MTEDVNALLKECGYPGMKVLEFAFDSRDGGDYRPHSYPNNCICLLYTSICRDRTPAKRRAAHRA